MRLSSCLRLLQKDYLSWSSPNSFAQRTSLHSSRPCSCSAPLSLPSVTPSPFSRGLPRGSHRGRKKSKKKKSNVNAREEEIDHRLIGAARSLFTNEPSSPGTPFFLPDGTHIFQKLTSFLRTQYPVLGFQEVLTPTIYKEALWRESGHWENYKDDMFMVNSTQSPAENVEPHELENYGLKPMNCPGHCILFRSKRRSYKELPIRYAEFSPLHRNEISGTLSGLTRVRRFHQDDGHIFCRPSQVMDEVLKTIKFVKLVYRTLQFDISDLSFVLSTRPEKDFIGTIEEWDTAEAQLKEALDHKGGKGDITIPWVIRKGDGAFYGPKIDVILHDSDGKRHQTATIQLDFQLPKRFKLEYEAPAPEIEAKGLTTDDTKLMATMGRVAPVMIHRAILGSLERFIALLLEYKKGTLPFWLSPRQAVILTVTDNTDVVAHAKAAQYYLSNVTPDDIKSPRPLTHQSYIVDIDASGDSIAQKVARAKQNKYNLICVMGMKNIRATQAPNYLVAATLDVEVNRGMQSKLEKTWGCIEQIKPGSQAPRQKDRGVGGVGGGEGVRLGVGDVKKLITGLCENYL